MYKFCNDYQIACFRGSLNNVAKRFRKIVELYGFDAFVRICGDSPLLDPRIVDRAVALFVNGNYDLVTNCFKKTFPCGQSVEVINTNAFCHAYQLMREAEDLEHVTRFFYRNYNDYSIYNFECHQDWSKIRLCVDTREDAERISSIISLMDGPHWIYDLNELVGLYEAVEK